MRFHFPFSRAVAFVVLSLIAVASSNAKSVPVRPASNYGSGTPTFGDCLAGTTEEDGAPVAVGACEAFNPTPFVVSFDGLNYNVYQFVFGNDSPGTVLDVINLGSIAAGTTFSLPSLFDPLSTELFSCNNQGDPTTPSSSLLDSGMQPITGPCTPGLTSPISGIGDGVTENSDGSFTTAVSFDSLVLDVPAPVSAPEPSNLALLGVGLLAIGYRLRRTRQSL